MTTEWIKASPAQAFRQGRPGGRTPWLTWSCRAPPRRFSLLSAPVFP